MKYIKWLTVSLIIGLVFLLSSTQANAQQSNKSRVYINPSVTKVKPGEEFTVSVKADIINPKGNITFKLKSCIHYVSSSFISRNKSFIKESPCKFLTVISIVPGFILYKYIIKNT